MESLIGVNFHQFAESAPERVAIVDPEGREWTRGELNALANRLARSLKREGLQRGDVIAILAPNCAEYIAAFLAGALAGLYVVTVNPNLSHAEITFILRDSGARAVFVHERLAPKGLPDLVRNEIAPQIVVALGTLPGTTCLTDFIAGESPERIPITVYGRTMPYTSATTGRPKAVVRPLVEGGATGRENFFRWNFSFGMKLEEDNVQLCTSMLYYSAPLDVCVDALHMGHKLILLAHWDAKEVLEAIARHHVTATYMVPSMFVRLMKLPAEAREQYSVSSLRYLMHAGEPCPPDVKRDMIRWVGPILWEVYGAAEGQGTCVSSEEWLKYPGTVGRAIVGSEVRILNKEGKEMPRGEIGLVYVRHHTGELFSYQGDPEKTRAAYRGEFFSAGDIGYLNDEGYLFLCDRESNMIISGGANVYPSEIEQVLTQHEAVADCAVIPMPHQLLGQVPKAIVQVMPGVEVDKELTASLLRYLIERLSSAKVPKRIEYIEKIPRDPSGKLLKRLLIQS